MSKCEEGLIRSDALKAAVISMVQSWTSKKGSEEANARRQAFMKLIDDQQRVYQWVPVTESLPKEFENVLCYSVIDGTVVAYIRDGVWYSAFEHGSEFDLVAVQAWCPFPEPPKDL